MSRVELIIYMLPMNGRLGGRIEMTVREHIELLRLQARARREQRKREWEIVACTFCQSFKGKLHPPHFASPNCESGKRNHCTCSICF